MNSFRTDYSGNSFPQLSWSWAVILLIFLGLKSMAQMPRMDSLERVANNLKGKEQVDLLNKIAYDWLSIDNAKAEKTFDRALKISEEIDYSRGKSEAFIYKGIYNYIQSEYDLSYVNLNKGLQFAIACNDVNLQGYALLQLGNCFLNKARYDSSLLYYTKSYEVLKDSANPLNLSKLYKGFASYYYATSQPRMQERYYLRALAIREKLGDKSFVADILISLARLHVKEYNYEKANQLLDHAATLINNDLSTREFVADICHQKALIFFNQGNYESALPLYDSAKAIYYQLGLIQKYTAQLIDLSSLFIDLGNYEMALNNLQEAYSIADTKGYLYEELRVFIQAGWANYSLNQYESALKYANKAIEVAKKMKLEYEQSAGLNLKGVTYTELGNLDLALQNLEQALSVRKKLNSKLGMAETYYNLAILKDKQNKLQESLVLHLQSLALEEEMNRQIGLAWSYQGLSKLYLKLNDLTKTRYYLSKGFALCKKIRAGEVLIDIYKVQRDLYEKTGNYKESLASAKLMDQLKDSLHGNSIAGEFKNMQSVYEMDKKDQQIKLLNQEKSIQDKELSMQKAKLQQQWVIIIFGSICFLTICIVAYIIYRYYRKIKSLNEEVSKRNYEIQMQSNELHENNQALNELNERIAEQREEIQAQAAALSERNDTIEKLVKHLEEEVKKKSADLVQTNEELIKHNNELLQFSYTVSHNLRGPVARLLGLMNLLKLSSDSGEREGLLAMLNQSTLDLDGVLRDMNMIVDARNRLFNVREKISIQEEWDRSVSLLKDYIRPEFEIQVHFTAEPFIYSVRAIIQSVFYNLLSNAIKYRSPDRILRLDVRSYHDDKDIVIEFTDNGLGIDLNSQKENVFKLYKRFHTHITGKGLGLYLVKTQLEVLKGKIEVSSELNIGSTFSIRLPIPENIEKQILLQNEAASLYYDANLNCTVIIWNKQINSNEYRELFETVLQTLRIYNTPAWIADLRKQGAVDTEDQQWFTTFILSEAARFGLRRIAAVGFQDPIRKQYFEMMRYRTEELGVQLKVFETVEAAKNWIETWVAEKTHFKV